MTIPEFTVTRSLLGDKLYRVEMVNSPYLYSEDKNFGDALENLKQLIEEYKNKQDILRNCEK